MTDHVRIADGVVYKRVGDETILLDFDAGVYYGLDSVGARIWELLAEERSLSEIVDVLLVEYEVQRDVLAKDVTALIEELQSRRLITSA